MKKIVITTVGTSIFTNATDDQKTSLDKTKREEISSLIKPLNDKSHSEWGKQSIKKERLKTLTIEAYGKMKLGKEHEVSAEIKSLIEIANGKNLDVYLLATDTILSWLASEMIEGWFKKPQYKDWTFTLKKVDKLNVQSKSDFEDDGFMKLIDTVHEIEKHCSIDNRPILNISGGYKAIIPPLTLMGQLYNMPLNYIYEDSGQLIKFEKLPIQFDVGLVELYSHYLGFSQHDLSRLGNDDRNALEDLKDLSLFKLKNGIYNRTNLGDLFNLYIESEHPADKGVLGFYWEYKFYEWYQSTQYADFWEVLHSENIVRREIDIVLVNNNNQFIICEVKSFASIKRAFSGGDNSLSSQLKGQLEELKNANKIPEEYHLLIYRHKISRIQNIQSEINNLKNLALSIIPSLNFKVFHAEYDLRLNSRGFYKNPYSKLMSQKLTSDRSYFQNEVNRTRLNSDKLKWIFVESL